MAIGLTNLADFDFSKAIDDYKQDGQNVWQSAYEKSMKPYKQEFERSSDILKTDYSDAINKAYESYVVNKRALEFSNYGTGDVRNMIDAFRKSYEENKQNMYDTYLEKQSSLDTSYFKQALETQNLLDKQKLSLENNFDTVLNSSHKYLSDLFLTNPLLFNSNPFLNQFTYFDDNAGQMDFVDYTTFIELLTEPGTGKPKTKGGIEDLINLITSLGGKNQKDVTSYESYLMGNKDYNSFYNWLKNEGGLYTMYDILGFDENKLFKQVTETQDTLAVTYGEGANQRTMYKYVDYSTGKTYEPLDPTTFRMDGDNIVMYDDSYDLQYSDKEVDNKVSSILNIMSTGLPSPETDKISEGTVQIYDNNIYKFDGERWIKMVDGDYKVSDMIDKIKLNIQEKDKFKTVNVLDQSLIQQYDGQMLNSKVQVNDKVYKLTEANDLPSSIVKAAKDREYTVIDYNGNYYIYGTNVTDGSRKKTTAWKLEYDPTTSPRGNTPEEREKMYQEKLSELKGTKKMSNKEWYYAGEPYRRYDFYVKLWNEANK